MTTVHIDDLSARLQQHHAALGDGRDCRSDTEKAHWFAATTTCQRVISGLRNAPNDLARVQAKLHDVDTQRAAVRAKEAELVQVIADAPDPSTCADARERDRAQLQLDALVQQATALLGAVAVTT